MKRSAIISAFLFTVMTGSQAIGEDFNLLAGARATGSDSALGYFSLTGKLSPGSSQGFVLRAEVEKIDIEFAGISSDQDDYRLLLGYSFATSTGEVLALIGPTRVNRSFNGGPDVIADTGVYVGLEGYGYVGDRGFWAGIVQWSDPDEAFYARGFGTYLVGGNTSIGPDLTYLHEPDYARTTLGIRSTWLVQNTALSLIAGVSRQSGTAGPSESDGFLELQVGYSF